MSNIAKFEILQNVPHIGDIAYIQRGVFYEILGLADELPEWFGDFKEHPAHAWCVASFLKYEFEKTYAGWMIERIEY
ncbi:MAG: hypothetical protein N3F08_04190 [Crenarchaeota archaeon]|nr:hypothetical protein [Thermoproteota archaeon]